VNETPNKAESLHAIAHNLKKLVEEARKLNENLETSESGHRFGKERLSRNG